MKIISILFFCFTITINTTFSKTYIVDNLGDINDSLEYNQGDGTNTLRKLMDLANANKGHDTIVFSSSFLGDSIMLQEALPDITDGGLYINGDVNTDGKPDIVLNARDLFGDVSGISIKAESIHINGLVIIDFPSHGISITGNESSNAKITNCYIGTDISGLKARGNWGHGIHINGADSIFIGEADNGNVISGNGLNWNGEDGINATDVNYLFIMNNIIGLNANGTAELENNDEGISLSNVNNAEIGNANESGRNIVSGNYDPGIKCKDVSNISICGNYIGVDITGTKAIGNLYHGIQIHGNSYSCNIGKEGNFGGNIISGNSGHALRIDGNNHQIINNIMGTDESNLLKLGNADGGIYSSGNNYTISHNIIVHNIAQGITINGDSCILNYNYVGTTIHGNLARNGDNGLQVKGSYNKINNNTIAYNYSGIRVQDSTSVFNSFLENSIYSNHISIEIDTIANGNIQTPVIDSIGSDLVIHGKALPNASIQIFADSSFQGQMYLSTVLANTEGKWFYSLNDINKQDIKQFGLDSITVIQDSDGNSSEFSLPLAIDFPDQVSNKKEQKNSHLVYPNPSIGRIVFNHDKPNGITLLIYDNKGCLVEQTFSLNGVFNLHHLPQGVYYLKNSDNVKETVKFLKKN